MATGDLPSHFIYAIDTLMIQLLIARSFWIYPSQLTVEKASKSDQLADCLDLTFMMDSEGKLSTRLRDKRDDFDLCCAWLKCLVDRLLSQGYIA